MKHPRSIEVMSYPMLRLTIDEILEHWQELATDDIYEVGDVELQEASELLSDLFGELSKRLNKLHK